MTDVPPRVDLTNCDKEPIHTPGSIQSHGAMLVCSTVSGTVEYVSENAGDFLGADPMDLVGRSLADVIGHDLAHDLRNAAAKAGGSTVAAALTGRQIRDAGHPVDLSIHHHGGRLFVEAELSGEGDHARVALDLAQTLVRRIGLETDTEKIAKAAAQLVRAMLGYDRVMVYRFLYNGAGKVIGEARKPGLDSFLGQHFPASDIPVQARRLYLINTIRMIGDARYEPVPMMPAMPRGSPPIDMSHAHLRSVSPIHCEYLRNMGVSASMSISIIIDGELWGLIACHNDTPKLVPLPLRLGAELFGQYLSLQLALTERRTAFVAAALARDRLDTILKALPPDEPVDETLRGKLAQFAELIESDGAGLWIGGSWTGLGAVPNEGQVKGLVEFLVHEKAGHIWWTPNLRSEYPPATDFGDLCVGLLAIPISSLARDFLLLFRGEEAQEIAWAGEPLKRIVSGPHGDRLTPRGSFEVWKEDVRGQSTPWTEAEQIVAESVRTYLRDVVLRYSEATEEERQRADRRRRMLTEELNHRVKNIIAVVKSIALQTGAASRTVEEYSRSLEGRLRALAFAHDQTLLSQGGGDLETLVEAEAGIYRETTNPDRVKLEGPPVGLQDHAFGAVALLIHEMLTNAAKYGALSTPSGRLAITWSVASHGDCILVWEESDGPVVAAPTRSGFGSKVITSAVSYDLGGTVELDYRHTGLCAKFVIPARHIKLLAERSNVAAVDNTEFTLPPDTRVLLVEDQALIAMDTEEALRRLGAAEVRAAPTRGEAMAAYLDFMPNCAVLDFNLGEDTSADLADRLAADGIPFIFVTGYGDEIMIPERFRNVPILRKPVGRQSLASALSGAFAAAGDRTIAGDDDRQAPVTGA